MSADLFGLLADQGIRLKTLAPGHQEKILCPRCHGGKSHDKDLSVHVNADGTSAVWKCHNCDWHGGVQARDAPRKAAPAIHSRRPQPTPDEQDHKPDWLYEWWGERRIGARVINLFGLYALRRHDPVIVFPYRHRGQLISRKYRALPKHIWQDKDCEPVLFNADALDDAETIIWVEGEPDVLAIAECGMNNVVSLRDGAGSGDQRFAALATHEKELKAVKKFILACDSDKAGTLLREELARRLGRHRVSLVTWPDGCKDSGEVLLEHGPDEVLARIAAAEPYPIAGIYSITPTTLARVWDMPMPVTLTTGVRATDLMPLKLPGEGRLIVVTGYPNHGKSAWTRFVMVHTATRHNRRWLVFSPEHQPWEYFVAECAEVHMGKPFWPIEGVERMSLAERDEASTFLAGKVTMMVCDAEGEAPTLDWILERAVACVLRDGVTDLQIDPWNEVEHARGDLSETEYIGRCLQRLKAFAGRHGCNVWVVAHPAKPAPLDHDKAPGGYAISGSSHWNNKADLGLTVWIPHGTQEVELHIWKSRFRRWGSKHSTPAKLEFDQLTGRYSDGIGGYAEQAPNKPRQYREDD